MKKAVKIGEDCLVLKFTVGAVTVLYRANAMWTQMHVIILPSKWTPQASSSDLKYTISDNKLYQYNASSFRYV